ncbi:iron-containing redox enzyme family protein [Gordonia sp. TBRC 11910]|uniref:Iron-containing redox enzyme family protein n=1 Tax=Gordonia asplenii TaxID=2725283 RepID=A0A848KS75_9ACTN|nr:iron-containing redox enzyme family protein [Gordonia asplenii]NMO01814.1 iron-containing redox enzyme family protein [Gordonia asplenii]
MKAPRLPRPRGRLSEYVVERLATTPERPLRLPTLMPSDDPYGDDLQLTLLICYELFYRGFAGVDPDWEWRPQILGFRRGLEQAFERALRADVPQYPRGAMDALTDLTYSDAIADEPSSTRHLETEGTWQQYREYFALRSIYQLKEADPHAWVIPRLSGAPKAALIAVEFDEYGAGIAEHMHQKLFADLLTAARLRSDYLGYLDVAPVPALLVSNVISYLGLHRRLRGAVVGHLAATEITSPPGAQRLLSGLERLDAPQACRLFYREHVEADAVHEHVMRNDVVGALLKDEPDLESDVSFGIGCFEFAEDMLADHVRGAWVHGRRAITLDHH